VVTNVSSNVFIDEADALLSAIRGGILVHLQDGILPEHLKVPLDSARLLNQQAAQIDDDEVRVSADSLEVWLSMLAAETEPITQSRKHRLLDLISELEIALLAYRSKTMAPTIDVADFVEESLESIRVDKITENTNATSTELSGYEFEADSDIVDLFAEEVEALLENIQLNLDVLSASPGNRDALWEIKKSAHTLKGASGVVGLKRLSGLAHRVEDLLEKVSESTTASTNDIIPLLWNAAECVKVLAAGKASPELDARISKLDRQLDEAISAVSGSGVDTATPVAVAAQASQSKPRPQSKRARTVVRVSLDRLDELMGKVRDIGERQAEFERRYKELTHQLEETHNNTQRLQSASRKVDSLRIELSGHSEVSVNGDFRQTAYELAETVRDAAVINTALDNVNDALGFLYKEQSMLIGQIEERLMRLRTVEFSSIANRLQRTVRVTCDEEGKNAEVVVENGTLEVDTQVVEALIEPLLHLLKNAVVHGIESAETRRMLGKPEIGKITVRVSNKGPYIMVSVTDDGCGIAFRPLLEKAIESGLVSRAEAEEMTSEKIRELIFLPGLTTAEKLSLNAGRGVGMSIVRESVAASGGMIAIETWPQKGTTFSIRIPRPFAELRIPEMYNWQEPEELYNEKTSVLIVDDSPSVRMMTSKLIENEGWYASTARDGLDAFEKLRTIPAPNVILSDIEMPRMGGYEFVKALRADESLKHIPVIFISSRTADRERAALTGVKEYLTKPFDESRLLELIRSMTVTAEVYAD